MVDRLEDDQIKISHPKIILDIINQVKLAPKKTRQTLELAPSSSATIHIPQLLTNDSNIVDL